jgi:hypothetical protein
MHRRLPKQSQMNIMAEFQYYTLVKFIVTVRLDVLEDCSLFDKIRKFWKCT